MAYNTREKRLAYYNKNVKGQQWKRRKYFREYNRRNKIRLKAIVLMGDVAKIMNTNKKLVESIDAKTELIRKEQIRLDRKLNQIKKFINIK